MQGLVEQLQAAAGYLDLLEAAAIAEKISLLQAFAHMEGFYAKLASLTIPERNHNPGDICDGDFARHQPGYVGHEGRFATFDTDQHGFDAQRVLLQGPRYRGKTIEQVVTIYAPPNENDTRRYIALVCALTGLPATTVIDGHLA